MSGEMIGIMVCALVCGAGGGTLATFAVDGPIAFVRDRAARLLLARVGMERVVECRPCCCVWCGVIAAAVGLIAPWLLVIAAAGLGAAWVGWWTLPLGVRDQAQLMASTGIARERGAAGKESGCPTCGGGKGRGLRDS